MLGGLLDASKQTGAKLAPNACLFKWQFHGVINGYKVHGQLEPTGAGVTGLAA